MFFEKAIKLAESDPDSGLPFMAYEGKAKALVALGEADEAKTMLEDAFAKARKPAPDLLGHPEISNDPQVLLAERIACTS